MSEDWPAPDDRRRARIIRWTIVIGVVLLATLGGIVVFGVYKLGVCIYDYQVSVTSASATPIKNVRGKAYYDIVTAREVAANLKVQFSMPRDDEDMQFNGKSLGIVGLYTCNSYCLDLIHTGSSPRHLVLLVDYADGKRENKLVEIPPGPSTQRLLVEVP